jgi:hypothetical protein
MISRNRIRLAVASIAALGALALPASSLAAANKAHVLKLYKVEQHVDLEGEDGVYQVTCPDGDYALDGMWRIDDIEQDNDFGGALIDLWHTVRPVKAASIGASTYEFKFTPLSGGDVQMKLWVTCIDKVTMGHPWTISSISADNTVDTTPVLPANADYKAQATCSSGSIVVSPGFEVTSGSGGNGDLALSKPDSTDGTWDWEWYNWDSGSAGIKVSHTWRCLTLLSGTDGSSTHKHKIVRQVRSATTSIPANTVKELQVHCGEHYKGLVGGWDLRYESPPATFSNYLWYLGMDPRIKTRAFKIANPTATPYNATGWLVCFKDKTT